MVSPGGGDWGSERLKRLLGVIYTILYWAELRCPDLGVHTSPTALGVLLEPQTLPIFSSEWEQLSGHRRLLSFNTYSVMRTAERQENHLLGFFHNDLPERSPPKRKTWLIWKVWVCGFPLSLSQSLNETQGACPWNCVSALTSIHWPVKSSTLRKSHCFK